MAVNFQKGWIKVASEKMDDEGNHHVEFELADEFIDWFMQREGLSEWSDEAFQRFMTEDLPALLRAGHGRPQKTEP